MPPRRSKETEMEMEDDTRETVSNTWHMVGKVGVGLFLLMVLIFAIVAAVDTHDAFENGTVKSSSKYAVIFQDLTTPFGLIAIGVAIMLLH